MRWKHKAAIQNLISCLPGNLSNLTYYTVQRHFGALRRSTPVTQLATARDIVEQIREHSPRGLQGATVLEVGTGRGVMLPTMFWLCGAARIMTIDLNRYLKEEIVRENITYLAGHRTEIFTQFEPCCDREAFASRFDQLIRATGGLRAILDLMNVQYLAPADARAIEIPSNSIDFHVSCNVLEHIPPAVIEGILKEGARVLAPDGLFLHHVDCSDHFAHQDKTISNVNFLQYGDRQWDRYAGNQYMYHNRLRVDDFHKMFAENGLHVLRHHVTVDPRALAELRAGFPVHERFKSKPPEINAATKIEMIADTSCLRKGVVDHV